MALCFVFPTSDTSSLNEPVLQEQVEKLNRQNAEHSHGKTEADNDRGEDRGSGGRRQELILDGPHTSDAQAETDRKEATKEKEEEEERDVFEDSESEEEKAEDVCPEQAVKVEDDGKKLQNGEVEEPLKLEKAQSSLIQERYFHQMLPPSCSRHKI